VCGPGSGIRHVDEYSFEAEVIYRRGPSPFFFAPLPPDRAEDIRNVARRVTYGWGMIPVTATIGEVAFYTALFPKDETYLLPLKAAVRRKADITAGDRISVRMTLKPAER
jgi:hypothetical protein